MDKFSPISEKEMLDAISKHEVFSGFDRDATGKLEKALSYLTVAKNSQIFEMGDQPNLIYYLLKGTLTLKFPDNSIIQLQEGELIGEIGVLNGDFRLGTLTANADSAVIAIDGARLFDSNYMPPETSLTIIRRLSRRVTSYLRSVQQTSTRDLILQGEDKYIEFKSTLRWNLKANKNDKNITHSITKTIAAFLNTNGGILLIGVSDDGEVLGLDADRFENEDKILLFLTNIIKSQLGTLHLDNINFHTERITDRDVLRVDVQAGSEPCYLSKEQLDHFYIRTGPSTTDLRLSKVFDYLNKRFV
jgi:CRP-like cAMP-binding protein